MIFQLFDMKH